MQLSEHSHSKDFKAENSTPLNLNNWETRSLDLLRKAIIKQGIKASCTNLNNYGSVFTRDAVMAGIAGLLFDDLLLINGLQATVEMLFKSSGAEGQIASNYKITDDKIEHISFGTLSPKIDAATWYLVAIGLLMEKGLKYELHYVEKTIALLNALEYNGKDLIYIPQGGNWADEYPYEGYILYDQILRCWALQLLGKHFDQSNWLAKADSIQEKIRTSYFNKQSGYFNCSFTPAAQNPTFDFAAHALLGIVESGKAHPNYEQSLTWINDFFLSNQNLPVAFYPVIDENHTQWEILNQFHLFKFKNQPHHYHNGGIWLIWLGWYALVLKKFGKEKELKKLASITFNILNSIKDFNFEEYLSGDQLQPCGTKELCYTATGILFFCDALKPNCNINLF